jgi:hypothetical protein
VIKKDRLPCGWSSSASGYIRLLRARPAAHNYNHGLDEGKEGSNQQEMAVPPSFLALCRILEFCTAGTCGACALSRSSAPTCCDALVRFWPISEATSTGRGVCLLRIHPTFCCQIVAHPAPLGKRRGWPNAGARESMVLAAKNGDSPMRGPAAAKAGACRGAAVHAVAGRSGTTLLASPSPRPSRCSAHCGVGLQFGGLGATVRVPAPICPGMQSVSGRGTPKLGRHPVTGTRSWRRRQSADCSPCCGRDTMRIARSERWPRSWHCHNRRRAEPHHHRIAQRSSSNRSSSGRSASQRTVRGPGWPCRSGVALRTRRPGRSRITFRTLRPLSAAHEADG